MKNQKKIEKEKKLYNFKVVTKEDNEKKIRKNEIEKEELINFKLNEKAKLEELAKKRNEEIKKRKFSNYVEKKYDSENENTKFFYDENVATKFTKVENLNNSNLNTKLKKKLEPKTFISDEENLKKEKNIVTALNVARPIAKLKNKEFKEKTEIFYFDKNDVELDINQKVKISEYVNQIKDKPIKIEIKTNSSLQEDNINIAKSRSLLIRAFLVKLGISHNRITIEMSDSDSMVAPNEVLLSFIEL